MQNCFEHNCSDGGIQISIDAKKMFGAQEKTVKYERIVLIAWKNMKNLIYFLNHFRHAWRQTPPILKMSWVLNIDPEW